MINKIGIKLLYILLFIFSLLYFSPKENIYYFAENQLKPQGVIIAQETVIDTGFSFRVENATVLYRSINVADIKTATFKIFLLFNKLNIENITLSRSAKNFVPLKVDEVNIKHYIVDPIHIYIDATGQFGQLDATYNLLQNSISVTLKPSKLLSTKYKNTLNKFKKNESGELIYEQAL
jgi:hypothetical protein